MKIRKPTAGIEESDGAAEILVDLAKESGANFLGLGINGCSRNRNKNPKSDEQATNLGKETDGWGAFLGLGIDSSSFYEINDPPTPPLSEINHGGALNPTSSSNEEINHGRALNPTPLRSYHPAQGFKDYSTSSSDHGACCGKKRMREDNKKKGGGGPNKRSRVGEVHPDPTSPPQELVRVVGPNVRPVFLYRKQLAEWDTREDQNRLFVNDRRKLMDFMTEDERLAVEDREKPGIALRGIDSLGREYGLRSNLWPSLDKVVVNKGWYAILADNGAEKGDWVHLWAFRRGRGEFCLYVDFRHQP